MFELLVYVLVGTWSAGTLMVLSRIGDRVNRLADLVEELVEIVEFEKSRDLDGVG